MGKKYIISKEFEGYLFLNFKRWLEEKGHISILESVNWKHWENEIFINVSFLDESTRVESIESWYLKLSKKLKGADKLEKKLEIEILIHQWLLERDGDCETEKSMKKREKELSDLRWQKKKNKPLFLEYLSL
ncbi:MAG: hypothetical protein I3274_06240 [Candidatus Moeniiplasma glomeromycotorum]|nr:hypothetical protein [Candidatus Moeniiplasma glomeromycotorum]